MKQILYLLISLAIIHSNNLKGIASSALDFAPVVGNLKNIGEAVTGEDLITGQKLSTTERALSLLGAIPGFNLFKNSKHLKNGQKFIKAAKRALKAGKIKNAVKFVKSW